MKTRTRLIMDSVLLGVVGALGAGLFVHLLHLAGALFLGEIAGYRVPALPSEGGPLQQVIGRHGLWLVPLATTLGGLVSGVLVYSLAPEAEGHGTDTAVKAFHRAGGFIRARVAPLKAVASAITIGAGGSAGREGPTALFSAGVGSIYASLGHRSDQERRLLVLVGMAAGLSAIFRSPIGTAIFAIEVLYSEMEFEASALIYTMIGSVTAYSVAGLFIGWSPLFHVPPVLSLPGAMDYGWYLVLGVLAGLIASVLPVVFYGTRDAFRKLPLPPHVKPAIGGLGVGLLALALPQVLGGGYGWIQLAIDGKLVASLLFILIFAKLAAFTLTVSSGGSGGVFAPTLFVGAMLGGFLADVFHLPPAPFAIVGMGAVFAGAAQVPIATLLMVAEMTGGFDLLVPAALSIMVSYLLQRQLSFRWRYRSLYEAQVLTPVYSPAHHVEHIRSALRLMGEHPILRPETVGHLDLQALLESNIPVDLGEGHQLMLVSLEAGSPWVGLPIRDSHASVDAEEIEVVAVMRGHEMLASTSRSPLAAGDRILLIAAPTARDKLDAFIHALGASAEQP
jgi:chloride channel protein, CIC family